MTITPEELYRLRGLCRDATEGPWFSDHLSDSPNVSDVLDSEGFIVATTSDVEQHEANAELIAAAREALPRLLDEVERLRKAAARFYECPSAACPVADPLYGPKQKPWWDTDEARAEAEAEIERRLRDE